MKKIKKTELLKACETILQEYKDGTHTASIRACSLCRVFMENYECQNCPFTVWHLERESYNCMERKCFPVSCTNDWGGKATSLQISVVIEFYEKFIKKLNKMTEQEMNKKGAFEFLKKIDKSVAKKYEL